MEAGKSAALSANFGGTHRDDGHSNNAGSCEGGGRRGRRRGG